MKFRKKPSVIDAVRVEDVKLARSKGAIKLADWITEALDSGQVFEVCGQFRIKTLEGVMEASDGDWIIRGVKGELYPCKPDVFKASYEQVPYR